MGCDEIGIAGAVQGSPVRLVKARTVDTLTLADAELVLEGYVDPRDRRFETKELEDAGIQGRFHFHPEWAGYMGKAYRAPTFHVTGITMRKPETKPIIFALGVHTLTTPTSTRPSARRRFSSFAIDSSRASSRTWSSRTA